MNEKRKDKKEEENIEMKRIKERGSKVYLQEAERAKINSPPYRRISSKFVILDFPE